MGHTNYNIPVESGVMWDKFEMSNILDKEIVESIDQLNAQEERVIKDALDKAVPGWTLADLKDRAHTVQHLYGNKARTLMVDDKPLLIIYEATSRIIGDKIYFDRKYEYVWEEGKEDMKLFKGEN